MDESGSLQGVSGAFAAHLIPRDASEFLVDQRGESVEGSLIASTPGKQKLSNVPRMVGHAN